MSIVISDKEFSLFRDVIYREAGINLGENKKQLLVSRLNKRFLELNIRSFTDYYEMIMRDHLEMVRLLDCISTNLTEFFREEPHFNFLQSRFIPEKKAMAVVNRKIRVWCAASSTGEEPYSIAITLLEGLRESGTWNIKLLASDISTEVLQTAREGVYNIERLDKISLELRKRYFLEGRGGSAGSYKIKDEVKDLLIFRRFNLMHKEWPIRGEFDLIFCRNVLIYFDQKTQEEVVRKLSRYLNEGGYLILGHSEGLVDKGKDLKSILPSVFQKVGARDLVGA